ncbi:MAG: hypothetical protein NDJ89_02365 [Oligoflexia bacterium]|nr:hypothetical protein [Oligoflexia bacterium]
MSRLVTRFNSILPLCSGFAAFAQKLECWEHFRSRDAVRIRHGLLRAIRDLHLEVFQRRAGRYSRESVTAERDSELASGKRNIGLASSVAALAGSAVVGVGYELMQIWRRFA